MNAAPPQGHCWRSHSQRREQREWKKIHPCCGPISAAAQRYNHSI